MGRTPEQWKVLAERRIKNILRDRRLCSQSQLEAKISEAGPPGARPIPEVVRKARGRLLRRREIGEIRISGVGSVFYTCSSFDAEREKERYERVKRACEVFERVSQQQKLCGDVAEGVIYEAIIRAGSMHVFGGRGEDLRSVNGKQILDERPLDYIVTDRKTGLPLGVEIKNRRGWYHWRSQAIWENLAKCVSIEVLPVFVCRKFDYLLPTRIFSVIGCFGYQMHNQYFHPSVEEKFADVRHKDGLGFADVRFPREVGEGFEPESRHVKYFRDTIPKRVEDFWGRYIRYLPVLREYLVEKRFWDPWDEGLFRDLMVEVFDWFIEV